MTWQEVSALAESKVHLSLIQLVTMLVGSAFSPLVAWGSAKVGKFALSMFVSLMGKMLYGAMSAGFNAAAIGIVMGGLLLTFSTTSMVANGSARVHQWLTWKSRVEEPIVAAYKTSNAEKAKKYLSGALDYIKTRNAHTASTAVFYDSPDDDMYESFVTHVEAAEKSIDETAFKSAGKYELVTNAHGAKLKDTGIVTGDQNHGFTVNSPYGSALAPYNTEFFVAGLLGLLGIIAGSSTLIVSCKVQKKNLNAAKCALNDQQEAKATKQEHPGCVCPGGHIS